MNSAGVLELAALGRPFTLGTLYNYDNDTIVHGKTPWNQEDLTQHIQIRPHKHADFDLILSDSLETKTTTLSVDLSVKASIFFGLYKYEANGAYLFSHKTSKDQTRITVNYSTTTHFKELSMYHLKKLRKPSFIKKGSATHVVTGILYGSRAFFVFDWNVCKDENYQNTHGDMGKMVNKIAEIFKKESGPELSAENFTCTFYGESGEEKKINIAEAKTLYEAVMKNEQASVPMKVFLLPLTSLSTRAFEPVCQISVGLVQEVQKVLQQFIELDIRCNDVLDITIVKQFPEIEKKIEYFKKCCSALKDKLRKSLEEKYSNRESRTREAELADILKKKHSSFSNNSLNWWLDCKEREIYTIKAITEKMKNTNIVLSENCDHETGTGQVLSFVFTSLGNEEPFLSALSAYVPGTRQDDPCPALQHFEKDKWYVSKKKLMDIREKAKVFGEFAEANKSPNIKFLVVGLRDDNHEGSTIYFYENGSLVNKNMKLSAKPEAVTADNINHNSVTLKVSPPRFGAENITSYSVEFCVNGADEWKKIESKAEKVTIGDLEPNTEYVFRCTAMTSAGFASGQTVSDPIKTLPKPPEKPQVKPNSDGASVSGTQ